MVKFKIGDNVMLNPKATFDTEYVEGIVTGIDTDINMIYFRDFDNNMYCYYDVDLILISNPKYPKFKAGDLAWSPHAGFVTLISLNFHHSQPKVSDGLIEYNEDGKYLETSKHPTLLTIEEAAKLGYFPPKKMIKKTKEIWLIRNKNTNKMHNQIYNSLEETITGMLKAWIDYEYEPIKFVGEWEEEE